MNNVRDFIKTLKIYEDDIVVLACSYGPDSMCLLDILIKANLNIVVAHVNHKIRKESDDEYLNLQKYCQENGLIFEGTSIPNYPKENIENYARNFRYNFFETIVKKYNAKYLFTAHHGDDLVETILMRLSRGASLKGYSGFAKIRNKNGYYIVRPLVYITKDEIIEYVNDLDIPHAIDKTNLENNYTRNKYRNRILPLLKEINPDIHKKYIKFSDTLNEYNDYIEKETDDLYSKLYFNNHLDLNDFNLLPLLLKKTLLNKILLSIYNDEINRITDKHIAMILKICDDQSGSVICTLPSNIVVNRFYNILEFKKNDIKLDNNKYTYILEDEVILKNSRIFKKSEEKIIKSNYIIRLLSKELTLPLIVRNYQKDDIIKIKNGTKRIKDILINSKIPRFERYSIPIVCDSSNNVLWIPGVKKSKFDKNINEEYDIILKYVKKDKENYDEK